MPYNWQHRYFFISKAKFLCVNYYFTIFLRLSEKFSLEVFVFFDFLVSIGKMKQYERERERNVLFNDTLSTFYLRLYGVRHMVKDHSDSEKGNPLPPHRLLFPINSKGSFKCTIPQTG